MADDDYLNCDIPQAWIHNYTHSLIKLASRLPLGSDMRASTMVRAEFAIDLVKAFRESKMVQKEGK